MNPIEENATKILINLFENNPEENLQFDGEEIEKFTNLVPTEINNAIDYLDERGLLDRHNYLGTTPYSFGNVRLNSRGNYIYHELQNEIKPYKEEKGIISKQPLAAGSPYGFTDIDWEFVQKENGLNDTIKVVLGYQFESEHYNTENLEKNIKDDFENSLQLLNQKKNTKIKLNFKLLAAGYGEHLFNQIARDIISSDIAVFETSDLNPNVMIEMGVALTWGKRVLPIKQKERPTPPSDISGQTYANYNIDAKDFQSKTHNEDIVAMMEWAYQKKRQT